jgi:hypothetical protein
MPAGDTILGAARTRFASLPRSRPQRHEQDAPTPPKLLRANVSAAERDANRRSWQALRALLIWSSGRESTVILPPAQNTP